MANRPLHLFVQRLRHSLRETGGLSDAQLLERFLTSRDEAAFEVLVWRYGPLVLGVCSRLLGHEQDTEDVFQATFLALARKAGSIDMREALAGWLHTTASRTALRLRARRDRPQLQGLPEDVPAPERSEPVETDLRAVLDEEIARLPLGYRLPVILVYFQGRTIAEAAQQLGCPRGTVCSRLSWARKRLSTRLTRRGFAGAAVAAALAQGATRAASVGLVQATLQGALAFKAGAALATPAAALAEGVLQAMFLTKVKLLAGVLLAVTVAALGVGLFGQRLLADKARAAPELVAGDPASLRLPADMVAPLGIQTAEVQPRGARQPRSLRLAGSLALDPERLVRIRSHVTPAEVVEIGKPILMALAPAARKWTLQTTGVPPLEAPIAEVGTVLDPTQNTVVARGWINNPHHKLRAGQFITATITLPPDMREVSDTREVVVPAGAVIEQEGATFVFVQPDPKQSVYRLRRVLIVRRGQEAVHIRSPLSEEEEKQGFHALRAGDCILNRGVVELKATLDDLKRKEKR